MHCAVILQGWDATCLIVTIVIFQKLDRGVQSEKIEARRQPLSILSVNQRLISALKAGKELFQASCFKQNFSFMLVQYITAG